MDNSTLNEILDVVGIVLFLGIILGLVLVAVSALLETRFKDKSIQDILKRINGVGK